MASEGDGSKSNGDASSGYYYKSMDHRDEDQMHKRDREQHIDTYVVTNWIDWKRWELHSESSYSYSWLSLPNFLTS